MDLLLHDVEELKKVCDNVGMLVSDQTSHMLVRFALDTSFLSKFTARQWGIIPKKPIIIQLKFGWAYVGADDIPGVFIFQSEDPHLNEPSLSDYETEFGVVQWFLETRLTEVLRSNWEKRPADRRIVNSDESSSSTSTSSSSSSSTSTSSSSSDVVDLTNGENQSSNTSSSSTTPSSSTTTTTSSSYKRAMSDIDLSSIPVDTENVEQLKLLGFTDDQARAALTKFTNHFESALSYLLANKDSQEVISEAATEGDAIITDNNNNINNTSNNNNNNNNNNTNNNNNSSSTPSPSKGKKRSLSSADDDQLAQLIGLGFHSNEAIEALGEFPSHTPLETVIAHLNKKTQKNATGEQDTKRQKQVDSVDTEKIQVLLGLGFTESEAGIALSATNGDLAKAAELFDSLRQEKERANPAPAAAHRHGYATPRRRRGRYEEATEDDGYAPRPTKKIEDVDVPPPKSEVNLWTDKPFLVELYNYINMRFITCPGYCLICDRDLDITTYKLPVCRSAECVRVYESTACGNNQVSAEIKEQPEVVELLLNFLCACISSPYQKGWNRNGHSLSTAIDGTDGSGASSSMNRYPQALLGLGRRRGYGAAPSAGGESFEPFPYNLGFEYDNGTQNIKLVKQTLNSIPSVAVMRTYPSDAQLKAALDDVSPLAFGLLRWVLRSARAHLTLIPPNKQIDAMGTPYQFQIVSTNPEHERTFQKWKQRSREEKPEVSIDPMTNPYGYGAGGAIEYVRHPKGGFVPKVPDSAKFTNKGSFHAFHGSPISNWHSIVRTGLRGGHVPGIYMAQAAAVSHGYMQVGTQCESWANTSWECDGNMSCMGMAEVADMCHKQELLTAQSPTATPDAQLAGIVNVAMDYSLVVARYLFFYPRGPTPDLEKRGRNHFAMHGISPFNNVFASRLIENEYLFLDEDDAKVDKVAEDDILAD